MEKEGSVPMNEDLSQAKGSEASESKRKERVEGPDDEFENEGEEDGDFSSDGSEGGNEAESDPGDDGVLTVSSEDEEAVGLRDPDLPSSQPQTQVCSAMGNAHVIDSDYDCLQLDTFDAVDVLKSKRLDGKRYKRAVEIEREMKPDLKVFDKTPQPNSKAESKDLDAKQVERGGSLINSTSGYLSLEANGYSSKNVLSHAQSGFEEQSRGSRKLFVSKEKSSSGNEDFSS
ncbi:hypothetical protein U1Q18_009784 [Sarracenia purpurea var. burkii]